MRTILRSWISIAIVVVTGAPVASGPETVARVSVVFVTPEGFTDAMHSKTERRSPVLLLQRQCFIFDTAAQSKRLKVKITDVNLAAREA
jgi:hypothetical protein